MPKSKSFLPDVNVWLALAAGSHAHHRQAADWLDGADERAVHFCRVTQMSLLRLLTQPKVMGSEVLTLPSAWETYDLMNEDLRISFMSEPVGVEEEWRVWVARTKAKHATWTDTYLAAFSVAADLQIVTFDKTFPSFRGRAPVVLSS